MNIATPPSPPVETVAPRETVYTIQVMRGLAAAAVAVYHTHLILLKPEYGGHDVFGTVASRGWLGVNFFFVLSGFIIMFAHAKDMGRPDAVGRYAWRRFVRVYPIYWIFTLLYIAAAAAGIGYPDFRWDASNLIASFLLILTDPAPSAPLQVAWTLFYEVMFYFAFVFLILNRTLGIVVFALWLAGILIYSLGFDGRAMGPFNMWNVHFLLGIGVYFVFRRGSGRWAVPIAAAGAAGLALLIATGAVAPRISATQDDMVALFGIALVFALILSGVTLFERDRTWKPPAILLLLGDASYSVYLVHSPALSLIAALYTKVWPWPLPDWLLFICAAIASLVVGVIAHLAIEKPLLKALHMRIGRADPQASAAAAAG